MYTLSAFTIPDLHLAMRHLQGIIHSISKLIRIHSGQIIPQDVSRYVASNYRTVIKSIY